MKAVSIFFFAILTFSIHSSAQIFSATHKGEKHELSGLNSTEMNSNRLVGFLPIEQVESLLKHPEAVGLRIYNIPKDNNMFIIVAPVRADGFDIDNSYWHCSVANNKLAINKLGGRMGAESLVENTPNVSSKFTSFFSNTMLNELISLSSQKNGISFYVLPTGKGLQKTHLARMSSISDNQELKNDQGKDGIISDLPCPSHCLSTVRNSKGEVVEVKLSTFAADPNPLSGFAGPYIKFWH